jgi:DNA-binding transcriptional regulator YhcF (GntR family)
MKLTVKKTPHFGVKEQIKRQIKSLIESGKLQPGEAVPSARDLALTIGVNRNTTWAAYRELTKEGWLSSSVGSGTYVKNMKITNSMDDLNELIDEMLWKAERMGYDRSEISDRFLSRLSYKQSKSDEHRILVVECNRETGLHLAECLEKELKVSTEVMLIQEVEKNSISVKRLLNSFDLVVCGFNHLKEFKTAIPNSSAEVVGILMQPDWKALQILQTLPPGSTVGLTCANYRSTETLFKKVIYDSGSSLKKIWAGLDDSKGIQEMLKECDIVMASSYVYERIKSIANPDTKVIMVELHPDQAGIAMVQNYLANK